jgi:predicted 2-oxoglutarate/Fe(II)-dependent dioxygenase YbiX/peroxiredoxin
MSAVGMPKIGVTAPNFSGRTDVNDQFAYCTMAGRWNVLMFFGSMSHPLARSADETIRKSMLFDDYDAAYFGVTNDPDDRKVRGLRSRPPGCRYFYDDDGAIARLYGVLEGQVVKPAAFLLDRALRVVAVFSLDKIDAMLFAMQQQQDIERQTETVNFAPVLTVPRIFEPQFCRELIAYHKETGGGASGFMREVDGKTVGMMDSSFKVRRDRRIEDKALVIKARDRIHERLRPAIFDSFNWMATRIERYMVACYSAEEGGFFRPHRDNTSSATAHRQFAVTLNLNDEFEGGELRFPEFGQRTYRPPVGGATVFNCSLLHEATPVTRGVRYAFVPFLYDEKGAEIRRRNIGSLVRGEPVQLDNNVAQAAE